MSHSGECSFIRVTIARLLTFPVSLRCIYSKAEVLGMIARHSVGEDGSDEQAASVLDVFLLGICVTCALCTEVSEREAPVAPLIAQILDLRHEITLEPDSTAKLLVRPPF